MTSNEEAREMAPQEQPREEVGVTRSDFLQLAATMQQLGSAMQGLGEMARGTNERITMLERQVALLTKVTSAQAKKINGSIQERALAVAQAHHMEGMEAKLANAIRKDIRTHAGVNSIKEIPKCEYPVYLQMVQMWDDFRAVRDIKKRAGDAP